MGSIPLPPLNPDTVLGHWRPENKFIILVNHLILLFKFFIYKFKNHNFAINIYKFKLFTMSVQEVEQKIAYQNNKFTIHFDKGEPILHTINLRNNCNCNFDITAEEVTFTKYLPLPNVIARQLVSICMLLQSGVLSARKNQNSDLFSVFWHFVVVLFVKIIVLYFLQDSAVWDFYTFFISN